jgi:hypothetical protein
LPLFVSFIFTDNPYRPLALDDFAFAANLSYGCPDLHDELLYGAVAAVFDSALAQSFLNPYLER